MLANVSKKVSARLVLAPDRDANGMKYIANFERDFPTQIEGYYLAGTEGLWRKPSGGMDIGDDIQDHSYTKDQILDRIVSTDKYRELTTSPPKEGRVTSGDSLLAIGKTATYFHTPDKVAYADITIDGNRHTYAVRSKAFRLWLTGEYFKQASKGISAQPLQDALNTFEAIAIFDGETRDVHLRTAEHQGRIYLDLGTADWKAVEVDPSGWRIVNDPPVRFWRPDSLLPLPYPVEGGNVNELRDLLNVDDNSWAQIVTFLMFCYLPNKRYPVLVLSAMRGSGKTTAAQIIKDLIDPCKAPLLPLITNLRDLAVTASRRWLMVYDNVSHISNDESDNLCKLATGFGFTTRKLHTDDEETTIECTRPQIITAIDGVVAREDLGDRVLLATLGEITPDRRLSASEVESKIYDSRPKIFGALLTALSKALAKLPQTQIAEPPRMADYALFAVAAEEALGLEDGAFLTAFNESANRVRAGVIESSPLGEAIVRLVESFQVPALGWVVKGNESRAEVWKGTASELLKELESHTDDAIYRSRFFPKAANHLTRQLNRLAPDLRSLGIDVKDGVRSSNRDSRSIVLEKVVFLSSTSSTNPDKSLEPRQDKGKLVDDNSKPYRPLSSTSPESIVHSSSTNPDKSPEPRQREGKLVDDTNKPYRPLTLKVSSTNEVSSTYRPLTEPLSGKAFDGVVDDVDDVDDKKTTFSGSDRTKVNSDNSESYEVLQVSNIENHNFSTPSNISSTSSHPDTQPNPVEQPKIESEVIDCDDF